MKIANLLMTEMCQYFQNKILYTHIYTPCTHVQIFISIGQISFPGQSKIRRDFGTESDPTRNPDPIPDLRGRTVAAHSPGNRVSPYRS